MEPTLDVAGVHPGQVLALPAHLLLVVGDAGLVGIPALEQTLQVVTCEIGPEMKIIFNQLINYYYYNPCSRECGPRTGPPGR